MHSLFSDGTGSIDRITASAASLNLDFVILTDHGRPNVKSSSCTTWKNKVLLIGGTELSLNTGHLAAVGFTVPGYKFAPEPQEAIKDIREAGGVSFISHPYDSRITWTDWNVRGFSGIEILSSYTEGRKAGIAKLLLFPLKYLFNSRYSLLDTMGYPGNEIKKWDELNNEKNHRYWGIYALDAHAKLKISKTKHFRFPTYRSMFEILTVYVKIDTPLNKNPHPAAETVIDALRSGRFFNAIEGIAPANGFDTFYVERIENKDNVEKEMETRVEMGGYSPMTHGIIKIHVPFEFPTDITVYKDGKVFSRVKDNKKEWVDVNVNQRGIYRVEVFVPGSTFDDLPWIITNPFFIGIGTGTGSPLPPDSLEFESESKGDDRENLKKSENIMDLYAMRIEKNNGSSGSIEFNVPPVRENEKTARFRFNLKKDHKKEKDAWVALALRGSFDLSPYKGFVMEVKTDRKRRYWLEFRTGTGNREKWYRHSFLVDTQWSRVNIPFSLFWQTFGEKCSPDITKVTSIFISLNDDIAYTETVGTLEIKNFLALPKLD